jgi:hypothetical protein
LRGVLLRAIGRGHLSFVTVSLFCIIAAVINAASTTITNHAVVQHLINRKNNVSGRLAQYPVSGIEFHLPQVPRMSPATTPAPMPASRGPPPPRPAGPLVPPRVVTRPSPVSSEPQATPQVSVQQPPGADRAATSPGKVSNSPTPGMPPTTTRPPGPVNDLPNSSCDDYIVILQLLLSPFSYIVFRFK